MTEEKIFYVKYSASGVRDKLYENVIARNPDDAEEKLKAMYPRDEIFVSKATEVQFEGYRINLEKIVVESSEKS